MLIDYNKKCKITWAITKNCNYNCSYCGAHNDEEYSNKKSHDYVIDFLLKLTDYFTNIDLTLFGGEPTLDPNFNYILDKLDNSKLQVSLYSNCSADLTLYDMFCSHLNTTEINMTYHLNHIELDEYKYKLRYLLDKYPNKTISTSFAIGKDRKTEKEILYDFNDIIVKYNNYYMSLFPLIENHYGNVLKSDDIKDNVSDNRNKNNLIINETDINKMCNKNTDCVYTNNYIHNAYLYRCYKYNKIPITDLRHENAINKYLNIIKIDSNIFRKCKIKYCYNNANRYIM